MAPQTTQKCFVPSSPVLLRLLSLCVLTTVVFSHPAAPNSSQWPEDSPVRMIGDSVLAQKAEWVTPEEFQDSRRLTQLAEDMIAAIRQTNGAAIAANQIGSLKRMTIISIPSERIKEEEPHVNATRVMPPVVLVNPEWWPLNATDGSPDMIPEFESCLSVPNRSPVVMRHKRIGYRAQRLDGVHVVGEVQGRLSLLLQHEVDHLEGIVMTDHTDVSTSVEKASVRMDGLGAVVSTEQWEMMHEPSYKLETAMFPGARVVD